MIFVAFFFFVAATTCTPERLIVGKIPVILLLKLLHLALQQQQLLASDGGGVQGVAAAQPLLQGADLCLHGRLLLQTQRQLPEVGRNTEPSQNKTTEKKQWFQKQEAPENVGENKQLEVQRGLSTHALFFIHMLSAVS